MRRAENVQELGALTADAAKQSHLLENHRPGSQRKEKENRKNATGDPPGLEKDVSKIGR